MPNLIATYSRTLPNNTGFSLIEVVISIFILSFGILGAIKTQLLSIQASRQSDLYSTAVELASDMADRMRHNENQLQIGKQSPFFHVHFQSNTETSLPVDSCYTSHCSPAQLANADITEWLQQVDAQLPNARAVICQDSAPWNSVTNDLRWDCAADHNASMVIKLGWAEQQEVAATPAPRLAMTVTPY